MNVDVFWVAPDEDWITRGYADCALLESMLRNEGWEPHSQMSFINHDVRGDFPHYDGAVVCFSGMGLAPHADWIVQQIDRMAWSVVIITGNEIWEFPWERLPEIPTRKVWVMNPTPDHADLSGHLPGGWFTGTREGLADVAPDLFRDRPLEVFYGAQIINDRRRDALEAVRSLSPSTRAEVITTDRFMAGVPYPEWLTKMASAKAVPCPSGPMTLDANRPLAAMEAGCVPILDLRKPLDPQFDYWALVFGEGYPMPAVFDWKSELQAAVDSAIKRWPHQSNRVSAFWQQWKRSTIKKMHRNIAEVANVPATHGHVGSRITAVITSSPIPSHPDTTMIEQTIDSVRERLPHADIVVVFDGVRPEQTDLAGPYREYVRRMVWKCNWEYHNVVPVVLAEWGHQANATREALRHVWTDTILFLEHDTPIVGDIPWEGLLETIEDGTANVIRLHQDVSIHPDHEKLMLDDAPREFDGIRLRRTAAWWQRPHLADAEFYRSMLARHFPETSRTMIEDKVYGIMWVQCTTTKRGWNDWRVWIYQPEGDMRRSGHLDGRGDAPKYEMRFQ